ncbi:MAG TPA: DMT family transporter [Burkholderiales bacterium]|nr:DMT family transporter [Burkholderiales bacterium]
MRLFKSPHLLLALAMLCWAGNWVVGRAIHEQVPPLALNFWRWAASLLLILPVAWAPLRAQWPLLLRHWRWVLPMAAIASAIFQSMVYLGLQHTTALNGALLIALVPIAVAVIAAVVLGARISVRQMLGILISLAGAVAIIVRGDPEILRALAFNPGDLWILAAVPIWALYTVLLKRWPAGLERMSFLAAMAIVGTLLQAPLYAWEWAGGRQLVLSPASLAAIAYTAVFASFLAFIFYNAALQRTTPAVAGPFHHLLPAFTALLGIAFLGERFGWHHAAGVACIALGLYLTSAAPPSVAKAASS